MEQLTDVWILETPDEEMASTDLNQIIERAFKFRGNSERAYLRRLWDMESWKSIKAKLQVEDSTWYVWRMCGVINHLYEMQRGN